MSNWIRLLKHRMNACIYYRRKWKFIILVKSVLEVLSLTQSKYFKNIFTYTIWPCFQLKVSQEWRMKAHSVVIQVREEYWVPMYYVRKYKLNALKSVFTSGEVIMFIIFDTTESQFSFSNQQKSIINILSSRTSLSGICCRVKSHTSYITFW